MLMDIDDELNEGFPASSAFSSPAVFEERSASRSGSAAAAAPRIGDGNGEALAVILDRIADAFVAFDHEWRYTYFNREAERLLRLRREDVLGRDVWEAFPAALGSPFHRGARRALARQQTVTMEEYFPPLGLWLHIRIYPSPDGLSIYFQDVTVRRQAEEAQREATERERGFLRDVLSSVTDGKLYLCHHPEELPEPLDCISSSDPICITRQAGLDELRRVARETAKGCGHDRDRSSDLETAVGEAGMNAMVHAGSGQGRVCCDSSERGTVQVWITDAGGGIPIENLPQATLKRGYTTAGTMGFGLKMILQTVDRFYLLTGPTGTTVVLEQDKTPPAPDWLNVVL